MSSVRTFRWVSGLEGASLLLLVCVAMPLKHLLDMPLAVRLIGSLHGILFLAFLVCLLRTVLEERWPLRRAGKLLFLSMLPGGAFAIDRTLRDVQSSPPRPSPRPGEPPLPRRDRI